MICAVIDVGSNTVNLSVFAPRDGEIDTVFKHKEAVGLAGYRVGQRLDLEGVARLCETLVTFKAIALKFVPEERIRVFATASLREVDNQVEALEAVRAATRLVPEVLSGEEEAYLDFVGVSSFTKLPGGLLVDIGGASTELARFVQGRPVRLASVPIGCLSLYTRYASHLLGGPEERPSLRDAIRDSLDAFPWAETAPEEPLIGVGGTARASLKLSRALFGGDKADPRLPAENVGRLRRLLEERDEEAYRAVHKAAPERALTLIPGLLILEEAIRRAGRQELLISRFGVREGYYLKKVLLR